MKLEQVQPMIDHIDTELAKLNAKRDELNAQAKVLAAKKANLEYALKLAKEGGPVGPKAMVLGALGIESAESVNGGNVSN